jgi:hypothetical protein
MHTDIHALDRGTTVIGKWKHSNRIKPIRQNFTELHGVAMLKQDWDRRCYKREMYSWIIFSEWVTLMFACKISCTEMQQLCRISCSACLLFVWLTGIGSHLCSCEHSTPLMRPFPQQSILPELCTKLWWISAGSEPTFSKNLIIHCSWRISSCHMVPNVWRDTHSNCTKMTFICTVYEKQWTFCVHYSRLMKTLYDFFGEQCVCSLTEETLKWRKIKLRTIERGV